jgi:hypothetical protein
MVIAARHAKACKKAAFMPIAFLRDPDDKQCGQAMCHSPRSSRAVKRNFIVFQAA